MYYEAFNTTGNGTGNASLSGIDVVRSSVTEVGATERERDAVCHDRFRSRRRARCVLKRMEGYRQWHGTPSRLVASTGVHDNKKNERYITTREDLVDLRSSTETVDF